MALRHLPLCLVNTSPGSVTRHETKSRHAPAAIRPSAGRCDGRAPDVCQASRSILEARTPSDLESAFEKAEIARRGGKWVAGYVAYEAGYLLEDKLKPLLPENRDVPLLLMGIFDDADIASFRPRQRANPTPPAPLVNAVPHGPASIMPRDLPGCASTSRSATAIRPT